MAQSIDPDTPAAAPSNGHATSNGHANGAAAAAGAGTDRTTDAMEYEGGAVFQPLYAGSDVDKREFVRLTLQVLKDIGYT